MHEKRMEHNGLTLTPEFIYFRAALGSVNSQFIQRVYYWTPDYTAYMSALGMITGSTATMVIIPIMTRVFNVWDISLAIVGFIVNFASNLIKGCWLSENGSSISYRYIPPSNTKRSCPFQRITWQWVCQQSVA